MNLKFNASKLANHFFYISTLTNWGNSSFRKETKKEWSEFLGPLNKQEKKAVSNIEKILNKYQKDNEKWLQNIFYFFDKEDNVWGQIKKTYTKEEYQELQQSFETTSQKFEKLWARVDIDKVNHFFEQLNSDYYKKMFNKVENFFKVKNNNTVYVGVLPICIGKGIAGHSWGNKNMIVNVEFSMDEINRNNIRDVALLLAHEIFHSIFAQKKWSKIFKEEITKNKIDKVFDKSLVLREFYGRAYVLVNEALTATFCDRYYLEILYGRPFALLDRMSFLTDDKNELVLKNLVIKGKKITRDLVLLSIGYKMFPLVLKYIYENKAIDRKIIQAFIKETKEILRWENIK